MSNQNSALYSVAWTFFHKLFQSWIQFSAGKKSAYFWQFLLEIFNDKEFFNFEIAGCRRNINVIYVKHNLFQQR